MSLPIIQRLKVKIEDRTASELERECMHIISEMYEHIDNGGKLLVRLQSRNKELFEQVLKDKQALKVAKNLLEKVRDSAF